MEKHKSYEVGTHLERWLFRMAQRLWLNELRAQASRRAGGLVAVEDIDIPSDKPDVETNIFAAQVLSNIARLPEAQRATVHLVYIEGFSYREAADVLQIPIGTVMSRLAAARKSLITLVDDEGKRASE